MSRFLAAYSSSSSEEEPATSTLPPVKLSKRDRAMFEDRAFTTISASDLQSTDWEGKAIEQIRSKQTGAPATKVQKQKHHVNWLAEEAREKEMMLLEKNAAGKAKQRDTRQKYGW